MLERLDNFDAADVETLVYGAIARSDYGEAGRLLDELGFEYGVPVLETLTDRFRKSAFRNSVECRNVFTSALRRAYIENPEEYEQKGLHYFVKKA